MLRPLFYQVHGLREIETQDTILVKSATGVELQASSRERLGIGQLEEGYVGPDGSEWILLSALDSSPEPWDSKEHQIETQRESR